MHKEAFLFDNDGVLVDSSELHWKAWQQLMKEDDNFFMTREQFVVGFGKRNDLILASAIPLSSADQRKKWAERKEEIFRSLAKGNIELLTGMEEFLKELKEKKIPRIIASSTPIENLKLFLTSTVLGNYFNKFASAEECKHGKPYPDIFKLAAKRIGFLPEDCIVIEDAPAGIEAAHRAGCFVVAVLTTHRKEDVEDADLIIESPKELSLGKILEKFHQWKKEERGPLFFFRVSGAIFLILLGILGLFLPFAPGLVLIGGGIYLLNRRFFRRLSSYFYKKKP